MPVNTKLQEKIKESLVANEAEPKLGYSRLMVAICQIKLQNYKVAQRNCHIVLSNGFCKKEPGYRIFLASSQIEKLPELYILAGQPLPFLPKLIAEIEAYKKDKRDNSLVAHYAYALLDYLLGEDEKALLHCAPLMEYPKVKDMFAIGEIVQAIGQMDQQMFDYSFDRLLIAHRGMAKFGSLREMPEGYLSLAAMCLAKLARDRGLTVNVESEYLSLPYLDFLNDYGEIDDWPIDEGIGLAKRSVVCLYNWCAGRARMIARIPVGLLRK